VAQEPVWAVWSVWRGDRAKLSRIPRAMEACYPEARRVRAEVEVSVLDDRERYDSCDAFVRDAAGQSTAEFDTVTFDADGREGRITVSISRQGTPGVTLTIKADADAPDGWAEHALETIRPAVSRGAIQWRWASGWPLLKRLSKYEPEEDSGSGAEASLEALASRRRRVNQAWTSLLAALVLAAVYAVWRQPWEHHRSALELGLAAVAVLIGAALLGALSFVRDAILPAVEIADKTPGRRQAGRLGLAVAPIVAAVVKKVF